MKTTVHSPKNTHRSAIAFSLGTDQDRGRFAAADALRASAIFAVVLSHLISKTNPQIHGHVLHFWRIANWGVDTFFTLTGFLLARPFLRYAASHGRSPDIQKYLIRRFLRIVPVYLVALSFSVVVVLILGGRVTPIDVAVHALMLQDFSTTTVQTINGPLWTMPVDFEFYLALPFFAAIAHVLLQKVDRLKRNQLLYGFIIVGIIVSILYRYIAVKHIDTTHAENIQVYVNNGIGMLNAFLLGAGLSLFTDSAIKLDRRLLVAGLSLAAVLFFFVALRPSNSTGTFELVMGTTGGALCSTLFLLTAPEFVLLRQIFEKPVVASAASLAYGIYLFHLPVLNAAIYFLHIGHGMAAFAELSTVTILVLLPIALLSYRFVERPLLDLKDKQR